VQFLASPTGDYTYLEKSVQYSQAVAENWPKKHYPFLPTSKDVCLWTGAAWGASIPQNFNNVPTAMLTLFEVGRCCYR
jgi:hypothetical protein